MADLYDSRLDFVVNFDVNKTIIMVRAAVGEGGGREYTRKHAPLP